MPWLIRDTSHGRIHLEGEELLIIIRKSLSLLDGVPSSECMTYDCLNVAPDLSLTDTAISGNAVGAE